MNDTITPELMRLHAYVDGQLDDDARREVEIGLADNPEACERVQDYQRMNELLRQLYDPILEEPVPPTLQINPPPQRKPRRFVAQSAAAALLLTVGLLGGFYLGLNQTLVPMTAEHEAEHVVTEAVMAYTVYTPEVRHPVEVPGDQRDHLVSWLSKRMGTNIVAPHLEGLDMRLLGGRLLASEDGPGALLMYEDPRGRRIVIHACLTDGKSSAFHYARQSGVSVYYWVDNAVSYAVAGEMDKEKLRPLAESAYNQLVF